MSNSKFAARPRLLGVGLGSRVRLAAPHSRTPATSLLQLRSPLPAPRSASAARLPQVSIVSLRNHVAFGACPESWHALTNTLA